MKQNKIVIFFVIFFSCIFLALTFLSIFVGPILVGFLISYLLDPFLVYFERKGVSRNTSAVISIILIIILISILVWIIFPIVISQIQIIISHLPDFRDFIEQKIFPRLQHVFDLLPGKTNETWNVHSAIPIDYQKISQTVLEGVGEGTRFVLTFLLFIITAPIFTFLFMKYLPKYYSYLYSLVPHSVRPTFSDFFKEVDKKLKTVLRGHVLIICIMTFLYPIAFLISGLPTAIAIGVLVGLARIVSGLDILMAVVLGSIVLVANQSSYFVVFSSIFAFACLQGLDMFIINPRVMGKFSGLHPMAVLIAVVVFGYWFGIFGVLLAIPIATIMRVAYQKLMKGYEKTKFFMH